MTADPYLAMFDRAVRHFGRGLTLTLRRRSSLRHRTSGTAISALTVATAALAGATALDLEAALLKGELVVGAKFTIAGDATVYTATTTNDAGLDGKLQAVGISPALAQNAALGAAVTVTQSWSDETYPAARASLDEELLDGYLEGSVRAYRLSAAGGKRKPLRGDLLWAGDGSKETVGKVATSGPAGGDGVGWNVWVGVGA